MTGSSFPASWPHDDPYAVTGYELEADGTFLPDLDEVSTIPAASGLWTTAADLCRFGTIWHSLLPAGLAGEALRPQVTHAASPGHIGLGWRLNTSLGTCSSSRPRGSRPGWSLHR
jgi:CubicO group peptidase (beta-lactamase class C family)